MRSSCKDCPNRRINCHASCPIYIRERERRIELNEKIRKEKQLDAAIIGGIISRVEKKKKKRRG